MAEKKKVARKPTVRRKQKTVLQPEHVATRAYYLHLEDGSAGELDSWLRAERELATA